LFELDKEHTLTLISGYNVKLRQRIIQRWQELEAQPSGSFDLATMTSAALRELAAKVEEVTMLKAAVITMQPKADFYDHVAGSESLFDRADAAKMLRTGPKRLWAALRNWKIVQASGTPYQKYYDLGYFRLVPVLIHKGEYSIPYQQTMVTGKGLVWLKALMDSQVMPGRELVKGEALSN
jgi:phage antirepressor YoqD-like protein